MGTMRYKPLDKVRIKSLDWYNKHKNRQGDINYGCETEILFTSEMSSFCGQVVTITRVRYIGGVRFYHLAEDKEVHLWVDGMFEGLVEEETLIERVDDNGLPFNEWLSHKGAFHIPDGYVLKDENGNVINATKIVLEKKKKEYPKTYEECCKILGITAIHTIGDVGYKIALLRRLEQLLICRDAYWKIAGEEMGLEKPWEPDWEDYEHKKFVFIVEGNTLIEKEYSIQRCFIAFPTEEMRDAFYENFKELIEQCKELL